MIGILLKNPRSPFDTAQGERGLIDNVRNFSFMLSLSKHSKGFFSRIDWYVRPRTRKLKRIR